jgi:coenzyme F420-reducing hydrogenase beta subunit
MPDLRVIWQTERQADETALFTRESHGLRDRAAALIGDSPRTATEIAANLDFRLFRGVLDAMNSEFNPEGDDVKTSMISQVTKEWFEQKLIETVVGIRMLENSSTWTPESLSTALEPAALTAAFISDTYNTRKAIVSEIRSRIKPK